jgi:hypothetical protein
MFGNLFSKRGKPTVATSLSVSMRGTLYGDEPMDRFPPGTALSYPWTKFIEARELFATGNVTGAVECWREVVAHPGLESRIYAQAWFFLRAQAVTPPPEISKQLLGVVIEVGMPKGLDVLAAYPDYAARYYNFSGRAVIWEHPDASLNSTIDTLLTASAHTVAGIGPWIAPRPGPPLTGHARIAFLTPSGLHAGQGSIKDLAADPIGGPVLLLGSELMKALIGKAADPK